MAHRRVGDLFVNLGGTAEALRLLSRSIFSETKAVFSAFSPDILKGEGT